MFGTAEIKPSVMIATRLLPLSYRTSAALFPDIEQRSASGDLATSGMSCNETILREGAPLCVAGHVEVTAGNAQFHHDKGKLKVAAGPSRQELSRIPHSIACSYWVAISVAIAIGVVGHVLELYLYPAVWFLGAFELAFLAWFLRDLA